MNKLEAVYTLMDIAKSDRLTPNTAHNAVQACSALGVKDVLDVLQHSCSKPKMQRVDTDRYRRCCENLAKARAAKAARRMILKRHPGSNGGTHAPSPSQ